MQACMTEASNLMNDFVATKDELELPEDQDIVGVYCSTSDAFPQCITRLGFILGKFEEQAPRA